MPWSFAGFALALVGTAMSAEAQSQQADAQRAQGIANQQAADYQARSMDIRAGQERAVAQRKAVEQRWKGDLVRSRAQAIAAAGGGGATDPSVITNDAFLTRDTELGALTALYQGEQSAQNLETGAVLKRYEGSAGKSGADAMAGATDTAATATVFSGLGKSASLYGKYGPTDTGAETP